MAAVSGKFKPLVRPGLVTLCYVSFSPDAVSESVVLLADEWLLQLPLEALKTFAVPQITSISRDFSLQFHYHRVHPAERSGTKTLIFTGCQCKSCL